MGNATSCAPSIISNGVVKVMFSDGSLQVYTKTPVRAAELMLENPGKFVCDSSSLRVGHRIQGVSADAELERRKLYFVLPMELLYSVLTQEEMSCLSYKATRAVKKKKHVSYYSNNLGKIFPEFCLFPSEAAKRVEMADSPPSEDGDVGSVERLERLYSNQRSWKPALETIAETPSRF